jgi:AbrB family looped-hinge helix DNA binding protein
MLTVKIGRRGQITIPSEIRRKVGLREGDMLALFEDNDQVILKPLSGSLLDLRGSVTVSEVQDFEHIREAVLSKHADE